jgi:NAD-dependent dihydropyrimidine dehydrogenase PreA subunit
MGKAGYGKVILSAAVLMVVVVAGSFMMMRLWGGPPEKLPSAVQGLVIQEQMTLAEFGRSNGLTDAVVGKAFDLTSAAGLQQTIQSLRLSPAEITEKVNKSLAHVAEEGSKNWVKIAAKFAAWAIFLLTVFFLLRKGTITPARRKGLLLGAIVLFGVILGSDPSPMGTVKDAIVLLGKSGIVFPPRLIALAVMLILGTFLANKLLCSWGCQFGTLQDVLFRLGRDAEDRKGILPQIKVPFVVTNSIRIAVLVLLTVGAFVWSVDLIGLVDPFKIYNPAVLTAAAIAFIALILIAALFVYRPWCHFFCPFGLVGWLVEKISIYKIKVDYKTCTACGTCAKACPSTVMEAILTRQKTIPDCFSCGICIEACPTKSIQFATGKREKPPEGKFKP